MKKTSILIFISAISASALTQAKDINITSKPDFRDATIIQGNIRSECTELGSNFTQSTQKALEASGWQVTLADNVENQTEGESIKLEILNAFSSGNAYLGHHKSVTIAATLYKDGKVVDTYTGTRNSGGGFLGGFKGSCAVLYRCVDTLGKDLAKWLDKKN